MDDNHFTPEAGPGTSQAPLPGEHPFPGSSRRAVLPAYAGQDSEIERRPRKASGPGIFVATNVPSSHPAGAPPVILVPGLGLSANYLLPLARGLSAKSDVWILEVKRASTPHFQGDPGAGEAGRLIIEWMHQQEMASAVLAGHSFGAQVVAAATTRYPSRVRALVLIAPTGDAAARSLVAQAGRLLRDAVREPFAVVRLAIADYLKHPGAVFRMARAAVADDMQSRLPGVRCPARVICGSRDPVVSRNWARTVADLLPNGELVTIPGAAHALPFTHWQEVAAAISACCRVPHPSFQNHST